jgi:hypothetical protein
MAKRILAHLQAYHISAVEGKRISESIGKKAVSSILRLQFK